MKKLTLLKFVITLFITFASHPLNAVEATIAAWTFPDAIIPGNTISAECGNLQAGASILLNGQNGADNWALVSASGTASATYNGGVAPTTALCGVTAATNALVLSGSSTSGTGNVVFKISTKNYAGVKINYQARFFGTAPNQGFTTHDWSYSTDGINYTPFKTQAITAAYVAIVIDFSTITALDNQDVVYFKLSTSGATGTGSGNRNDNFNITATPTGCTPSSIAFANTSFAKVIGDANFTVAPTTLNTTTPFAFTSNNQSVATVNQTTGEVTIHATGVATITVNQAEGVSGGVSYCSGSAYYTIAVGNAARQYNLVKNSSELVSGDQYLLVGKTSGTVVYYAMGNQDASNKRPGRVVTDVTGVITTSTAAVSGDLLHPFEFTLIANGSKWVIKDVVNNQFVRPFGATAGLSLSATPIDWNIDVKTAAGVDSIYAQDATTYGFNILRFNSGASTLAFNAYDVTNAITKPQMYIYKYMGSYINVIETTIPAFSANIGVTDSKTIHVSGTALTSDISISITGANANQFSVNPTSLTQSGGVVSSTSVTVNYSPTSAGNHAATLNLTSNGATTVSFPLTGTTTTAINDVKNDTRITVQGKIVTVYGVDSFDVFNILGSKVKSVLTDGTSAQTSLNAGIYILRSNKWSQKIIIK